MTPRVLSIVAVVLFALPLAAQAPGDRPDPKLTPGVLRGQTRKQLCETKWGLDRRHVTQAMRQQVAAAYHVDLKTVVARGKGPCCELDHFQPRENDGADDVKNLWLQSWADATKKDALENYFHKQLCSGKMTLAQVKMPNDWFSAYKQYVH